MTGVSDTVLHSAQELLWEVWRERQLHEGLKGWPTALAARVATNLALGGYEIHGGVPVLVLTARDRNAAAVERRLLVETLTQLGFGQLPVENFVRGLLRHGKDGLSEAIAYYDLNDGKKGPR